MRESLIQENERKEKIKQTIPAVSNGNASYHLRLKSQAEVIKKQIFKDKLRNQPGEAVLEMNSRDGRKGVGALRRTIKPMPLSSKDEQEARGTATSLLSSSKGPSIDVSSAKDIERDLSIRQDFESSEDSGEQFLEFSRQGIPGFESLPNEFDGEDPQSENARFLEDRKKRLTDIQGNMLLGNNSEEEQERLLRTFGVDPDSKAGAILKECIPCGRRSLSLDDIEFSNPFVNTLEDLKNKYSQLLNMLNGLFIGDQLEEDLCDLLRLWNAQCLPDLFGIISLLGILQEKYLSASLASWENFLNSLIGPFLTPVIGPMVHNLERYVGMIVDPIICVIESLETQMYKLDVVGGINQFKAHSRSFNRRKIEFYDAKINSLEGRLREMDSNALSLNFTNAPNRRLGPDNIGELNSSVPFQSSPTETFPRNTTRVPFTGTGFDPENIKNSKEKNNFVAKKLKTAANSFLNNDPRDVNLNEQFDAVPGVNNTSLSEERERIREDIRKAKAQKRRLSEDNENNKKIDEGAFKEKFSGAQQTLDKSREEVEATKETLESIIYQITLGLNQGVQVVRDSLDFYREELERTVLGRVSTQEDQIETARTLQKIQRWISMVNALIKLKQNGWDIEEMCSRDDNSSAIGAFVGEFKRQPSGNSFNFFQGTDSNGNELLVAAPGGATVNVTSVDFEDIGSDELIGDVDIEDVQNTVSFNDLNEAEKLNRKGVLADLGDIDGKDINITLDDTSEQKKPLDLKAEKSYVIIKNNFCSKSPFNVGSADKIRKWAEQL